MTSLNFTKESPSGGEKLLRLLASGATPSDISESKGNQVNQDGSGLPLNFAQGNLPIQIKLITFLYICMKNLS